MNKSQFELDFLLGLFEVGYQNAYVSSMDLCDGNGSHLTRIEMVLQNVGRLCLYQDFKELDGGEQVPNFTVFYYCATNPNVRTKIINRKSLIRAINIVYKTKRFMENNPQNTIKDDGLFNRSQKNKELALKLYEKQMKKRQPFFQMLYKHK